MSTGPRIALIGLHLESNAFSPVSTEGDFRSLCYQEGPEILQDAAREAPLQPAEMTAFIRRLTARGDWQPVPVLVTAAEPGGPIDQAWFETILERVGQALDAAGPIDGAYISNHGGMVATVDQDPDGTLYALVRAKAGPGVPVVATVDLHANISDRMASCADVIVSYRTNPHVDQVECGEEAADLLTELLGGARWHTALIRLPLVAPSVTLLTSGAYGELIAAARREIAGSVVATQVVAGFAFSDTAKNGMAIMATGPDAREAAAAAHRIAVQCWAARERFQVKLPPADEVVARAVRAAAGTEPPVLIADVADNPGGGGTGNTMFLTEALIQAGVRGALVGALFDPQLAEEAHARGTGKRFLATFNRSGNIGYVRRYQAEARIVALSDGNLVGTRGLWAGRSIELGPTAALEIEGITVLVISRRKQCADPAFFTHLGLDPAAAPVVTVKSRGHFRAGFDLLFPPERILEADMPGLTSPILSRLDFRHLPRPVYPLDPAAVWNG